MWIRRTEHTMTCVGDIVDRDRTAIDPGLHRHAIEFTWISHCAPGKRWSRYLSVSETRHQVFAGPLPAGGSIQAERSAQPCRAHRAGSAGGLGEGVEQPNQIGASGRVVGTLAGCVASQRGDRFVKPGRFVFADHLVEGRGDGRVRGRIQKLVRRRRPVCSEPLDGAKVAGGFAGVAQHRHRGGQRANGGQDALEAGRAVGLDVQFVTAEFEVRTDSMPSTATCSNHTSGPSAPSSPRW